MAKKFNFDKKMENDANNVIEEILQADFPLPEQAEAAKMRHLQNQRDGSCFRKTGKHKGYI